MNLGTTREITGNYAADYLRIWQCVKMHFGFVYWFIFPIVSRAFGSLAERETKKIM